MIILYTINIWDNSQKPSLYKESVSHTWEVGCRANTYLYCIESWRKVRLQEINNTNSKRNSIHMQHPSNVGKLFTMHINRQTGRWIFSILPPSPMFPMSGMTGWEWQEYITLLRSEEEPVHPDSMHPTHVQTTTSVHALILAHSTKVRLDTIGRKSWNWESKCFTVQVISILGVFWAHVTMWPCSSPTIEHASSSKNMYIPPLHYAMFSLLTIISEKPG